MIEKSVNPLVFLKSASRYIGEKGTRSEDHRLVGMTFRG